MICVLGDRRPIGDFKASMFQVSLAFPRGVMCLCIVSFFPMIASSPRCQNIGGEEGKEKRTLFSSVSLILFVLFSPSKY